MATQEFDFTEAQQKFDKDKFFANIIAQNEVMQAPVRIVPSYVGQVDQLTVQRA